MGTAAAAAVLLVLLCCLSGSSSLTIGGISVPVFKIRGDDAYLKCGYQEDSEEAAGAINVTWYKDGVQFYHSVNKGLDVDITVNEVPGVQVDKSDSGFRSMTLKSLKVNSAGKYRCVAESLKNAVTSEEKHMLVIAPPTSDPVINGFQESVWVANGNLTVNCTAGKSFPAANITWSVDGQPADKRRLLRWPTEVDEEGLETSKLGLVLQLGPDPRNEKIHVTCDAIIKKTIIHTGEDIATRDDLVYKRSTDKTITPSSSAAMTRAGWTGALLLLLLAV